MKIVVMGGSGLIGRKVVERLRVKGHEVVAASPSTGVNALTGEGLAEALAGAQTVVDVTNAPDFSDEAVLAFFRTSGRNLVGASRQAGIGHLVALSVVGTHRLAASGYFLGKQAQEELIRQSGLPYTIVQATQFFEFLPAIAQGGASDGAIRLPDAPLQPIAADDVAQALAEAALAKPHDGTREIAGPERFRMAEIVRRAVMARGETRDIVADPQARYFGSMLDETSLVPGEGAWLGPMHFADWLARETPRG